MPSFETINLEKLKTLPQYEYGKYRTHLQKEPGNGCFLEPPGHPSYFTRSVYTQRGDLPHAGGRATLVLTHDHSHYVIERNPFDGDLKSITWQQWTDKRDQLLESLFVKLPLDHERTRLWIGHVKGYFANCYYDPTRDDTHCGKSFASTEDGHLWKVAEALDLSWDEDIQAKSMRIQEAAKLEWLEVGAEELSEKEVQSIEALQTQVRGLCNKASRYIRKYYPEYEPSDDIVAYWGKSEHNLGDWWETEAKRPSPEECEPRHGYHTTQYRSCQWCGYEPLT